MGGRGMRGKIGNIEELGSHREDDGAWVGVIFKN